MKKQWILIALFLGAVHIYAQTKEDNIKKEDVVVEFSFNPTLTDVFKLKTVPNGQEEFAKQKIEYTINPKQVPSDFVPITKQAAYVNIDDPKPKNYRSYLYGALGLYGNGEIEVMLRPNAVNGYTYGIDFSSYNSQNGIDNERVDNGQWKSNIDLFLAKNNKKYNWKTEANFERNRIHWYGLDAGIPEVDYQNQDVEQVYNSLTFSGIIDYKNAKVKSLSPSINFFSDGFESSEIDLNVAAVLNKSMFKDYIEATVNFEYLNGSFGQTYLDNTNINYSFFNLGVTPSYNYQADNFQLNVALGLFVNSNTEASTSKFWILPSIQADVNLIKDIMILHGGIRSNLDQNSYESLASKNPFIAPSAVIKTTATPVDVFVGLDGKLTKTISYSTEASYKQVKNKALFVHYNSEDTVTQPFQLGNSFAVIYDDVSVFSLKGAIEMMFSKQLTGGVLATVNSYSPDVQAEAWNLPNMTIETYANYTHNKWFGQVGVNIIDGRDDLVEGQPTKLDGFLDLNVKGGYKINKRLNAHVNIYNLLDNNYQSYTNYQVQGFQLVAGLSFKF
ncbi:hypothetical protein FHR24_000540 [Wenyingzhuangia heitensis]|uniref:TonB dependent receptor n=1 Tax=Wenyingzhuangia heitensis TaxID=1487859 RepID=A0ABX0UAB2_9FLAO|nr:TonB-dependent receptor [Wenyingzhuangia heitensis]NIJ44101.1 hypothetical protein [Wenyingzhuangia heitensis]